MRALLWQADGGTGHELGFMYKPLMDTLVRGFTHLPVHVSLALAARSKSLHVVHGYGNRYWRRRYALTPAAGLRAGDIFVWVGPEGSDLPRWQLMRQAGVRTIYFQTEPVRHGCYFERSRPDEIWEFSWHNFDECAPVLRANVTLRYVPLGFSPPPVAAVEASFEAEPRHPPAEAHALTFFGFPYFKSGRLRCYERLRTALGSRLNATWSVWSSDAFERWWRDHGRWTVHLNLHKTCENAHNPVVFRTALLLSRGAIVVSEHAYPHDEAEYDGLVHFGTVDELPSILARVALPPRAAPAARLSIPGGPSTPDIPRVQTSGRAAALFAARFEPQAIFQRAGSPSPLTYPYPYP